MGWNRALELEHRVAGVHVRQEILGVNFNKKLAEEHIEELTNLVHEESEGILESLWAEPVLPYGVPVKRPFKKDGSFTDAVKKWFEDPKDVGGPFTRIEFIKPRLSQRQRVAEQFIKMGWKPEWYTEKGSPRITKDGEVSPNLVRMLGEPGEHYVKFSTYTHRQSQIQGWLNNLREDGRLTAGAFTNGTNTGRFRHHTVVNVPKANDKVLYGRQMRELFIPSNGNVLVGCDASGLELRMLCHYMNDPEYTEILLTDDIHTRNQELAGLDTRDDAKTFIYAFLYGAGDGKIGSIVGGTAKDGKRLKARFLSGLPRLDRLINKTQRGAERGYLIGLDGRKIRMRRDERGNIATHKALNTLLQGAGAIIMKGALVNLNPHDIVLNMHDEFQLDVKPSIAEQRGEEAKNAIVQSGLDFELNIPLDAEYKIGQSWAETH